MGNFEDKMSRSAAKTLMSSLESLQSIHFKTNTLPDESNYLDVQTQSHRAEVSDTNAHSIMSLSTSTHPHWTRQIKELEDKREEKELEDIYLLQGAPLILMRRLFGMHASEFSRRRNILNIRGAGSGRPPLCDEETDHLVWKLWLHHKQLDERERFLKIADETSLDLHLIWSALREHIDS